MTEIMTREQVEAMCRHLYELEPRCLYAHQLDAHDAAWRAERDNWKELHMAVALENANLKARCEALEQALKKCVECIEVQNMHSWDECNTVEESIEKGHWCKMAIDAREQAQQALAQREAKHDG